jgi:hypothetical protein
MKKTILALCLIGTSYAVLAQQDSTQRNTNTNTNTSTNTGTNTSTQSNGSMNNNGSMNGNGSMNNSNSWMSNMNNSGNMNDSLRSTGTYSAYGTYAPPYVQSYITRDYPMSSNVMWRQNGDWWQGYYMENGLPHNVYYNTSGQTFNVALPVRQSLVPDAVISQAVNMYGPMVYDITTVKGTNKQDIYQVRVIENGTVRSEWLNEDGTKTIDIYRVETSDMNSVDNGAGNTMNGNNTSNTMNDTNNTTTTTTDATMGSSNTSDMNTNTKTKTKIKNSDGTQTKIKTKNGKTTVKDQQQ